MRITLSVPDELAARIKKSAGEGTVSGWVVKVIEEYFAEGEELELLFDEWLKEHPVDEDIARQVDAEIEKARANFRRKGAA
ncbi:MAG: hypothetical protein L0I24_20960 [Pseudonocardia sp.]|nr:hypothetical protein [Pseudonocardia sp.]